LFESLEPGFRLDFSGLSFLPTNFVSATKQGTYGSKAGITVFEAFCSEEDSRPHAAVFFRPEAQDELTGLRDGKLTELKCVAFEGKPHQEGIEEGYPVSEGRRVC